jgi:phosphatidylglycerophosphate synthase
MNPANAVTAFRAILVCGIAGLIAAAPNNRLAVYGASASTIVLVLDGVDGWIARRTGTVTGFGTRFDTETDALFVLVLSILAYRYGKAGSWVIASGLMRYAFLLTTRVWPWLRRPFRATNRGRAICVVQIAALIVIMLPPVAPPASSFIAAAALVALSYSFLADAVFLWRRRRDPLPS